MAPNRPPNIRRSRFSSREEVSDAGADGTPGPMAMIRFQWCVGKDYQEHLVQRLQSTVQHAYWDVLMEYRLLTCPVFMRPTTRESPLASCAGQVVSLQNRHVTSPPCSACLHPGARRSSSVPDVSEKVKSPKENPTEFNFSDSLFADVAPSLPTGSAKGTVRSMEAESVASETWASSSSKTLNTMFQHGVHGFLEGGVEIQKYVETAVPGSQRCFIVVGRDMAQWKAFMGISSLSAYIESNRATKGHKSTQLFEPHILPVTTSLETPALCRTPSTPSSVPPTIIAPPTTLALPEKAKNATAGADAGEARQPALIPRQRLLFLRVEDKSIATARFGAQVHTQRVDSCESCSGGPRLRRTNVVTFAVQGTAICGRSLFGDASGEFIGVNPVPVQLTSDQGQELFKFAGSIGRVAGPAQRLLAQHVVQKMAATGQQLHSMAVATQTPAPTSGMTSNLWAFLDHMISRHNPPSRHQEAAAAATKLAVHNIVGQVLRGVKPKTPMQAAPYATCDDPVIRHGQLVEFQRIYDDKGTSANLLVMPYVALKVAQVRDHTLEAAIASGVPQTAPPGMTQPPRPGSGGVAQSALGKRTRHSSGGSQKSVGGDASNVAASRGCAGRVGCPR
ncbi:hypothetical protein HPB52_024367 [Rhipicephalus sanguineus]|uniref:Uncharacterized protein n=1 Tax=Rhipicephalus sanguineus TaxID=34632 RepID=A0A9D4PBI6_RHISA|nr:hypothetical protein HPB52_024367 [Rhipicephalus sanguineus]